MLIGLIGIVILIVSVVLHEVSHGVVADRLGDPTARYAGRLTLNPLRHLDPVGSVILPAVLVVSGAPFVFGWAKPVPFNPRYLRHRRWGPALVGLAGPATNLVLAVLAGLLIRWDVAGGTFPVMVVVINLVLAVFNLLPVPPLDGSRLVAALLPPAYLQWYARLEGAGILIAIVLVYALGGYILGPPVRVLFRLITGSG
jgi:Zn-dependent protease